MIQALIGILIGLSIIALIMLLIDRPKSNTSGSTGGATAPPVLPASVAPSCPAPVVPATPARTSTSSSSSTSTRSNEILVKVWKFIGGLALTVVLLVFLVIGGWELKNLIDKYNSSSDEETVVVCPGKPSLVNLWGKNEWKYKCPARTITKHLNRNGRPIPVLLNGCWVDYIITGPEASEVTVKEYREPVAVLCFSAENPNSREYSFVVYKR